MSFVDGIVVEAYAVGAPDEVVATSLTYGIQDFRQGPEHGFYSLVVPTGDYVVRFSDLDDRFISFDDADGPFSVFSNDSDLAGRDGDSATAWLPAISKES